MVRKSKHQLRILDFDIENRPLSYLGQDFTTAEVTAVAASWVGSKEVQVWLLGPLTGREILEAFTELYDAAGLVTGHYIRKHDLPMLNGARMELGLEPLKPKLTSDTKLDLLRRSGISASQENLAAMLNVPEPKYHMNQIKWRAANRLTDDGLEQTRRRVRDDVVQHKRLRAALVENGWLGPPRVWTP